MRTARKRTFLSGEGDVSPRLARELVERRVPIHHALVGLVDLVERVLLDLTFDARHLRKRDGLLRVDWRPRRPAANGQALRDHEDHGNDEVVGDGEYEQLPSDSEPTEQRGEGGTGWRNT